MIGDLKPQEFVNGRECRLVVRCNHDPGAARCLFEVPVQIIFQLRHDCGSRNLLTRVDQHRNVKIARREHLDDVLKMLTNLVPTLRVLHVVRANLDAAAILGKHEMMGRFLVRKPHLMIPAHVQIGEMVMLSQGQTGSKETEQQLFFHKFEDERLRDSLRNLEPGRPSPRSVREWWLVLYFTQLPIMLWSLLGIPSWGADVKAPELPNFHRVNEHIYRGGQPTNAGFKKLAGLGVKTVIDLRLRDEHSTTLEARMVEAAGMRYVNVPMNGYSTPQDAKVSEVLALLDSSADGPVFVHCRRGSDRTGTVIACYRMTHDGWQNEKAKQEAQALGMRWFEIGMKHYIMNFKPASERLAQGEGTRSSGDQ